MKSYFNQILAASPCTPTWHKAIAYSVVSAATIAFIMVPAEKMEKDMTNEELIQPPSGYHSLTVRLKYKEFEIATVKILAEDHGTGVPMYFRITSSIKESDAVAFRTYHEVEGPYCDYLRQQYAKPVLLTGSVLAETPETKLDEKWTKWLCNFEPGCSVTLCGYESMWESLLSDCQIVCVPYLNDQILNARLMVEELKVAVEVEREDNGCISKQSLSEAIISVMDNEVAGIVKHNHAKLKEVISKDFRRCVREKFFCGELAE
ncbi:cyanidin 3-O-galactoside 2''-O-xylosyltransferase FGGT1, partial [Quercus suber]|uniref:cyanidin 3-O-galactoside 2''-O-xylosyltransferase FGGT1 n=1 Tax=Quercus suber TaxID=58331 RepID=UPI0032DFA050